MRAVIQRVRTASVKVGDETVGNIGHGLLVLLGVSNTDSGINADKMADRVLNLRVFDDGEGKMNLSCLDVKGDMLVVSQFTLYGDCRKGRRPSYTDAAPPEKADALYEYFVSKLKESSLKIRTGIFRAMMTVSLVNDGPVTLILET